MLQPQVLIQLNYDPNTGQLSMGGNIANPMVTVFVLEIAKNSILNPPKGPVITAAKDIPDGIPKPGNGKAD